MICIKPRSNKVASLDVSGVPLATRSKKNFKTLKIDMAAIPGGCTGLIQVADVSWNKPFKEAYREQYEQWMEAGDKTYTAAGNMRAPTNAIVVEWVNCAWEKLPAEMIKHSFKVCAISNATDGSEDGVINILKPGSICHSKVNVIRNS